MRAWVGLGLGRDLAVKFGLVSSLSVVTRVLKVALAWQSSSWLTKYSLPELGTDSLRLRVTSRELPYHSRTFALLQAYPPAEIARLREAGQEKAARAVWRSTPPR